MAYEVARSPGLIGGGGSGPLIPPAESGGAPQRRPLPGPNFQLPQGRSGMSDLLAGGGIDGLIQRLQGQLGDRGGMTLPRSPDGGVTPPVQTLSGEMPGPAGGGNGRPLQNAFSPSMPFKAPPTPAVTPPQAAAPPAAAPSAPAIPSSAPAASAAIATKPAKQPLPGSNADFAKLAKPPGRAVPAAKPAPMPQVTMPAEPAPSGVPEPADPWGGLAGTPFAKRAQEQGFQGLEQAQNFLQRNGSGSVLGNLYAQATQRNGGASANLTTMPAPAPSFTKPMKPAPALPGGLNILTTKPAMNPGGGTDPAAFFQGSPAGQNFLKRLQSLGVADVNEGVRLAQKRPDSVLGRMYANATQGMRADL